MAFENFPEADKPQTTVEEKRSTSKVNTRAILTTVLIAALLGTWGYILYDKSKSKEETTQKETIIATTTTQRDELQKELEDAAMRYDMLKSANSKKDSSITVKDQEIDAKKTRIQTLLSKVNATEGELNEARRLIASLNGDIDGYKSQIELLQGQKIQLIQEKAVVSRQRDRALQEVDSASMLIREKDELVNVGSTLKASNFNIVAINEKGDKEKTTSTAKRVDKLRITFDLNENLIAQSGSKEIFVCITGPDGTPVAIQALGSGTFSTREGLQKPYTQKLDVNYTQNKRQTVSFDWKQNTDFTTGNYKIEVYNNGFKVGEGYKTLKKGGLFS